MKTGHKKPGAVPGGVDTRNTCATAYPVRMSGCGRRAREVMPAAIQALVMMCERENEAAGMWCKSSRVDEGYIFTRFIGQAQ